MPRELPTSPETPEDEAPQAALGGHVPAELDHSLSAADHSARLILEKDFAALLAAPLTGELLQTDLLGSFEWAWIGRQLGLHFMQGRAVRKETFEDVLIDAVRRRGRKANKAASATNPGLDVIIDGVRWSCKTEGSQGMRRERIHISKFMECAWSKNFRTTSDMAASLYRVMEHLGRYDRVVILRSFKGEEALDYELLEIPHDMLLKIGDLGAADFSPLTDKGSSHASVQLGDSASYSIKFDGSDNKITLTAIPVSHCIRHANWRFFRH